MKMLVRRRIQDVLQEAMRPGTLDPPQRARLLPLPPMLYNMVVEDAIKVWDTDWDHLQGPPTEKRPSPTTQHPVFPGGIPSKKRKTPSAASRVSPFWLYARSLPTTLRGKALMQMAGTTWPTLSAEKQEEFKEEAKRLTEKNRAKNMHPE